MVVSTRLSWVSSQLTSGRAARISLNSGVARSSLHIVLQPAGTAKVDNSLVLGFMSVLLDGVRGSCVVDHGHQKSDGTTHVSISFRHAAAKDAVPPTGGGMRHKVTAPTVETAIAELHAGGRVGGASCTGPVGAAQVPMDSRLASAAIIEEDLSEAVAGVRDPRYGSHQPSEVASGSDPVLARLSALGVEEKARIMSLVRRLVAEFPISDQQAVVALEKARWLLDPARRALRIALSDGG